ncbi:MAG: PAS domain S-box protein [Nitrospirae bacterium]|nr:PAS domain S-box protein [Nitrospirota bacterium]
MQNILIVDDMVENLLVLETLLDQADVNIVRAINGKEALWKLLSDEFALLILDVNMPEMNGFEVANLIRTNKKTRTLPIIFISATNIDETFVFKGYNLGAVDYLVKPVKDTVLKSKVSIFLKLDKQRRTIIEHSQQLRKANEELRLQSEILANVSEGVILIKASDGTILFTNPKFEQMFGYNEGELICRNNPVVNAPTDKTPEETAMEIQDSLNRNNVWHGELRNIKKTGKIFWCYATVSTFDHPKYGKVWIAVHNDITQTKRAQEEVKTERDKLKMIMETMQDGVLITNLEYGIEYVNEAISKIFGEVNGRKCYEYFHNDTKPCQLCRSDEVFSGKNIVREAYSPVSNKTYSIFETHINNLDGTLSKFEVSHDITDIKNAQEIMKRELDLQSAIAEVSGALLSADKSIYDIAQIVHKQAMKLTSSAHGFVSEVDTETEEVITHALKGCIPSGHIPLERFLSTPAVIGDTLIGQIALANPEKDYTDEDLNIIKRLATIYAVAVERKRIEEQLKNLNNHLGAMVEEEIEKRRTHEQMLIQQSKMAAMGEMIGLIAHQWKQPLNAVGLTIQDIRDTYEYDELNEQYLDKSVESMMAQLSFMSKTIDDFRNFFVPSKLKVRFNVKTAIEELLSMFANILIKNNIKVSVQTDSDTLFSTFGYPNEFKQVVLSILNNSRDAIAAIKTNGSEIKGCITINISNNEDKSRVIVLIGDNGGGIADDIIGKIFEPYFSTKETDGSGIGLYMSKTIIETNMGGSLTVRNINGGAEFVISLDVYAVDLGK